MQLSLTQCPDLGSNSTNYLHKDVEKLYKQSKFKGIIALLTDKVLE